MYQKYLFLPGMVMFLLLFSCVAWAGDKEADELRGRAEQMMREVRELHDQGKHEEAKRLEAEVQGIRERAEQVAAQQDREPGPGEQFAQHIRQLREKLGEASRVGQREVAERLQSEIHDQVRKAVQQAEETAKRQMEGMQKKIDQLRKEGQSEAADRLTARMKNMMQDYKLRVSKWRESLRPQERDQLSEQAEQHRQRAKEEMRDFQRRMKEMDRKVADLHERGEHERAEQVAQELQEMVQQRKRTAQERDRPRAEEQQRDAERREIERRDAKREERERREIAQRDELGEREPPQIDPEKRADLERRMHHLRAAAENLAAIGMHDMVERLQSEADEIQRRLQPPRQPGENLHQVVREAVHREFQALNERLTELNRRLDELTETVRRSARGRRS